MGRDKRNEQNHEHFTKLVRQNMMTPAWRALSVHAQALYPWLKLEWKVPRANNNGKIAMSVRQAARLLGCSKETAGRALRDLQQKGWRSRSARPAVSFEHPRRREIGR